jgi:hypothetical protein
LGTDDAEKTRKRGPGERAEFDYRWIERWIAGDGLSAFGDGLRLRRDGLGLHLRRDGLLRRLRPARGEGGGDVRRHFRGRPRVSGAADDGGWDERNGDGSCVESLRSLSRSATLTADTDVDGRGRARLTGVDGAGRSLGGGVGSCVRACFGDVAASRLRLSPMARWVMKTRRDESSSRGGIKFAISLSLSSPHATPILALTLLRPLLASDFVSDDDLRPPSAATIPICFRDPVKTTFN